MAYLSLAVSVIIFLICFNVLRVVPRVRRVIGDARDAHAIIRSTDRTDSEKEAASQKAAIAMLGAVVSIVARVSVCVLVPAGAVWLGAQTGAYDTAAAMAAASDRVFIGVSSMVTVVLLVMTR